MSLPEYDVRDYFPETVTAERGPIRIAHELWGKLGHDPTHWFPEEKVIADFCLFDSSMGNGFAVLLGYGEGADCFMRGLLAARALGAKAHVEIIEEARQVMARHGLVFREDSPETWPETEVDFDLEQVIEADISSLDSRYWDLRGAAHSDGSIYQTMLEYIHSHREKLAARMPSST